MVHHNLVLTREVREFPERQVYYSVRDHVDGPTLHKLLDSGRVFDPVPMIKILRQLVLALTPIHAEGMAHGSIKPSNIFLCGGDRVVLGDLAAHTVGIGLHLDRLSYDYRYAPPEMFRQGAALGPWSDFYSLGCVAYELACGAPPFVSDNYFELAGMHDRETVEAPSRRGSRLGPGGDSLILRLLAKSPSDRLASLDGAIEALDDLVAALRPGVKPGAPSAPIVGEVSLMNLRATDALMSVISFSAASPIDPDDSESSRLINQALTSGTFRVSDERAPAEADDTVDQSTWHEGDAPKRAADDDTKATFESSISLTRHPPTPERIGRYQIISTIGLGGMGAVYLARDLELDRNVAIKTLRLESEHMFNNMTAGLNSEAYSRFLREAKAVARLNHPNIVSVYDIGRRDDGSAFIVLEYVDGGSLSQKLRGGDVWSPQQAAQLLLSLARGVELRTRSGSFTAT